MDDYIRLFKGWLYEIALNNVGVEPMESVTLEIVSRIDSGGLKQYIEDNNDKGERYGKTSG